MAALAILGETPGGSPPPPGPRPLAAPLELFLRFAGGHLSESFVLDPRATALEARFRSWEYDVLHPPMPGLAGASVAESSGDLRVELSVPQRLFAVRLSPGKVSASGCTLAFHRLDGQAVAAQPTVVAAPGDTATFPLNVTDVRFVLRLRDASGQPVPLIVGDLLEIRVQTFPTAARIGLAPASFFWQVAGEIGAGIVPEEAGVVDAGPGLVEALTRYFGSGPPPEVLDVPLVVASDAPCLFELKRLEVPYRLARRALASGEDKEVLRFEGGRVVEKAIVLQLPGGAAVASAPLSSVASFRPGRPVAGAPSGNELGGKAGARVDGRGWVAQPIRLAEAATVNGLELGLLALTNGTELRVELQEDFQGRPSGRKLAAGTVKVEGAGRRLWIGLDFPEPVVVSSAPCWLLLSAARGEAVWLTRPGGEAVHILGLDPSALDAERATLEGEALYRLLAPMLSTNEEESPAALRLGDQAIPSRPGEGDDAWVYDLAPALNEHLAAGELGPREVALAFTASQPGLLTVYTPRVEYDPPG